MEIWINPACSKSRRAIRFLEAAEAEYTVRRYLEDVPSEAELAAVLDRLGMEPWEITRTQEPVAAKLGIADWPREPATRDRWIAALAQHPKLIQRPIVLADDGSALVARSEEAVRTALERSRTRPSAR